MPPPFAPPAPPLSAGRFWAILVPDKYKGIWPYYTQDEALYNEFAEKGFCGMTPAFRDQFYYYCPQPHDDVGAIVIASIFIGSILLVLLIIAISALKSCWKKRRKEKLEGKARTAAAEPRSENYTAGLSRETDEEMTIVEGSESTERKSIYGVAVVKMGEEIAVRSDSDRGGDSFYTRLYAQLQACEPGIRSSNESSSRI